MCEMSAREGMLTAWSRPLTGALLMAVTPSQ